MHTISIHISALSPALCLLALAPSAAIAAEFAGDDIIVTATGIAQTAATSGQSVSVIDAATIDRRQLPDVAGLLATLPGVRVNRSGALGGVTGVSIRGAETTQTLVLIDGVKANDPSGIGDLFDFGNLMTGNIRHIEVLRGTNAVAHGSQAIGGVVAVFSETPADGFSATAAGSGGYRNSWTGRAEAGYGSNAVRAAIGVAGLRTDGISAASEARGATERDGFRNLALNARADIRLAGDSGLELRGWYINSDLDTDNFFGPPADTPDFAHTRQWLGQTALNLSLFDGLFHNRFALSYQKTARDYYFAPADKPDYGYRGETWRAAWQGQVAPGGLWRLIIGYDHEAPRYSSFGFGTAKADARLDSFHAIAIVEPTTTLSLTAGIRHDQHSMFGGNTSLSADASWAATVSTRLRLAYGEGFKAPSLYQLTDGFSGNPRLLPERARSYEAGIEQQLGASASLFATAFRRDTRNQISFDYTSYVYGNLDRTRASGVEAGIRATPATGMLLDASYSHVNARNRAETSGGFGNRLPRRPADAATIALDQRWAGGISTGATVSLNSATFDDSANKVRLPAYVLAGVRASVPLGPVELFGRIDNLFDEQYETAFGYGTYGRSAFIGIRARL